MAAAIVAIFVSGARVGVGAFDVGTAVGVTDGDTEILGEGDTDGEAEGDKEILGLGEGETPSEGDKKAEGADGAIDGLALDEGVVVGVTADVGAGTETEGTCVGDT